MTQTYLPTNWFSRIFLAAFLTIDSASAATDARKLNPAEEWVVAQVTAGEIADLSERFPDEKDRKLSAQFLDDLLTSMLPGLKPHRYRPREIRPRKNRISVELAIVQPDLRKDLRIAEIKRPVDDCP